MYKVLLIVVVTLCVISTSTAQSFRKEVKEFQKELNKQYRDTAKSPMNEVDRVTFKKFDFYRTNKKYRVVAKFERARNAVPFEMKTSTERLPVYELYGVATFMLDGEKYSLEIYQNHKAREMVEYKNQLFLPYKDWTNSETTYGGGRYIDLLIPDGDEIIIDFNQSYNPYCAYSDEYSCPIPPSPNHLKVEIKAGLKYEDHYHH